MLSIPLAVLLYLAPPRPHPTAHDLKQPVPVVLTLYDEDGAQVANCIQSQRRLVHCRINKGFTLDDVFSAWLRAYRDMLEDCRDAATKP